MILRNDGKIINIKGFYVDKDGELVVIQEEIDVEELIKKMIEKGRG